MGGLDEINQPPEQKKNQKSYRQNRKKKKKKKKKKENQILLLGAPFMARQFINSTRFCGEEGGGAGMAHWVKE